MHGDRDQQILSILEMAGALSIQDLADRFGVSGETIRRAAKRLESEGRLEKTHGGVRLPRSRLEGQFQTRVRTNVEAKKRIGIAAAAQIPKGASVFIDASSTSYWAARALVTRENLTVFTNGLEVALTLGDAPTCQVVVLGGDFSAAYHGLFGPATQAQLRPYNFDFAIIGVTGLDADRGLTDAWAPEAEISRLAIRLTRTPIIVADSSKFDVRSLITFGDFSEVGLLVTDHPPSGRLASALARTRVVIAEEAVDQLPATKRSRHDIDAASPQA